MTTVNAIDRWFDEYAEAMIGLPVAEAILDVTSAGLHVQVARPAVHRLRDGTHEGVELVTDRRGVVVDVLRLIETPPLAQRRSRAPRSLATP